MTTIDTARLRALAEEARHDGSWWDAVELGEALVNINGSVEEIDAADYIAAIDPPTLIALLDRLEELEGREPEWEYAVVAGQTTLPARFDDLIEAERHARAWSASAEVLRRRKAGEWEPVTGDDDA